MRYRSVHLLACALTLIACGPHMGDKAPPPSDTSTSTTDANSESSTSGATSSATGLTTGGPGSTSTGSTSSTVTTDPTTGGACDLVMCGGQPCVDQNGEQVCVPPCSLECLKDADCNGPGVLFCSGGGVCVDAFGTVWCHDVVPCHLDDAGAPVCV